MHLPNLSLAQVNGSPQIVERSESFIRDNPADAVAIFFATQGEAFFFHRGGNESLKPGEAIMYDADLPYTRGFARGLEELVLTVPRSVYCGLTSGGAPREPVIFPFGTGAQRAAHTLAKLVRRTVAAQLDTAAAHVPVSAEVERSALDLLRPLVVDREAGAGPCYVAAAKDYIEQHLADPDLSAQGVAAAVGISPRHLARAFADAGLTLRDYLRDRRLDRVGVADLPGRRGASARGNRAGARILLAQLLQPRLQEPLRRDSARSAPAGPLRGRAGRGHRTAAGAGRVTAGVTTCVSEAARTAAEDRARTRAESIQELRSLRTQPPGPSTQRTSPA
ncbi:hypothetical protein GCM10027174_16200 [Salinifilum aidingensis]